MRNRILFVVGWLLLCLTLPTLAQLSEDGTTFTFSNGLVLSIPDGWTAAVQDETQSDFVAVDDGRTGLALFLYSADALTEQGVETGADLIDLHYNAVFQAGIDKGETEETTLEGQDGIFYFGSVTTESDGEYEQAAYAFLLPDGTGLLGLIYPMSGSGLRKTSEEDAVPIIESLLEDVGDLPTNSESDGNDSSDIEINLPDIGPADHETDDAPSDDGDGEVDQGPHDFGYRTILTLPEGWTMEEDYGSSVLINDGSTKIEIAFYTPHRAGLKGRDAQDLLLDYFKTVNNAEANVVDPDDIEETDIAGLESVRYETQYSPEEGEEYELTVVSVILPNEAGIIAALYPVNSTVLESQFRALSVVEDFVAAQPEALDVVDLGYNVMFDVPRGWAVYEVAESAVDFDNGSTSFTVRTYYPSIVADAGMGSAEDVLSYYMENKYPEVSFRARDAETIDLGRLEGATFTYEVEGTETNFPRVIIATMLDDEQRVLIADIVPVQGDRLVGEDELVSLFSDIAAEVDDLPEEFVFTDESVFEIPRNWWYYQSTQDYFLTVENDVTGLFLGQYTPEEIEGISNGEEMLEFYEDESIPGSQIEEVEVGGIAGVRYETTYINSAGNEYERIEYAFILPNDYALIVIIYDLYEPTTRERDALPLLEDYLEQYN